MRGLLDVLGPEGTLMAYTSWQDVPPDELNELDGEIRSIYLGAAGVRSPRRPFSSRSRAHTRGPEDLAGRSSQWSP